MQKFKFVESIIGVSKTGRPYSFIKISDGFQTFAVSNPKAVDVSKYKKGDDITLDFDVSAGYNGNVNVSLSKVS